MRSERAREREKNIKIGVDDIWRLIIGSFVDIHDKNKYDRNRVGERERNRGFFGV
jgi:hypothetical protein